MRPKINKSTKVYLACIVFYSMTSLLFGCETNNNRALNDSDTYAPRYLFPNEKTPDTVALSVAERLYLKSPRVPWQPPSPSTFNILPRNFFEPEGQAVNLRYVDGRLREALIPMGYEELYYYIVPGGFALATRMEQMDSDGTSKKDPPRWSTKVETPLIFSVWDYLKILMTPQEGKFRVFLFLLALMDWFQFVHIPEGPWHALFP